MARTSPYLTRHPGYSEEFSRLAGRRVDVVWDRLRQVYVLHVNGRFNMFLSQSVNSQDRKRVVEHFRKLKSGAYDSVMDEIDAEREHSHNKSLEERDEIASDVAKAIDSHVVRQRRSIVLGG